MAGGFAVALATTLCRAATGAIPPARAGLADLPGARLDYWDTGGHGEAVVLLHPATGTDAIWEYQRPALIRAGYRVIAYSRRGFGLSDAGPAENPGSASNDLDAMAGYLGLGRFHLVGSAAGAFVALDYAISHSARLLGLTVANSLGGIEEGAWTRETDILTPKGFREMPADFRELSGSYRLSNPEGRARWSDLAAHAIPGRPVTQKPANLVDFAALGRITTPTLVLTGDADLFMPPARARELACHIPGARVAVIAEAGHSAYWEQPDAFNRVLLDFLRRSHARV